MIDAVLNAFRLPDLRRRILFTIGILAIYRLVAHIPVPGVDVEKLRNLFSDPNASTFFNLIDLFSGGAMANFSIASMGVYPYITASIIIQLLMPIIPALERILKEGGEAGRQKINVYTHLLTVPMAALQAFGQVSILQNQFQIVSNFNLFSGETFLPSFALLLSMVTGTLFCVWLGELITEAGIGQGVSIIIFGGIVARAPQTFGRSIVGGTTPFFSTVVFLLIGLVTVAAIVVITEAQRRIPVQYARRVRGTRMYGGQSTHIPLKVNSAGMIPLIFASSFLLFPGVIASFLMSAPPPVSDLATGLYNAFNASGWFYWFFYFVLVIGLTYFYTAVTFQQQQIPDNLQKFGGFIPGIRPGKPTADYLNRVLNRITLVGAVFLGLVAVLPFLARLITGVTTMAISSTGLLIVVGVVIDTMRQLEAQLMMRKYEGFIK